jgi:hypothetical protein
MHLRPSSSLTGKTSSKLEDEPKKETGRNFQFSGWRFTSSLPHRDRLWSPLKFLQWAQAAEGQLHSHKKAEALGLF